MRIFLSVLIAAGILYITGAYQVVTDSLANWHSVSAVLEGLAR